ncbi:MAG TPA: hypothetical protein VN673_19165 [Clostridia bacterium]|nr:hypothetical protein [Clostridia bacterium]
MHSDKYRVRRATLDDLPQLAGLWTSMRFNAEELARRATEFQVAEGQDGTLLGAIGLQIVDRQGCIHSEAFTDFSHADPLRHLLWDRLNSVATNHGLLRLWTQEPAPFWNHCGMQNATPELLEKMPTAWKTGSTAPWLTLKLKDDLESVLSVDREFALFMESEKARTQRALQQARVLKWIATLLALGLLLAVITATFFILRNNPGILRR